MRLVYPPECYRNDWRNVVVVIGGRSNNTTLRPCDKSGGEKEKIMESRNEWMWNMDSKKPKTLQLMLLNSMTRIFFLSSRPLGARYNFKYRCGRAFITLLKQQTDVKFVFTLFFSFPYVSRRPGGNANGKQLYE